MGAVIFVAQSAVTKVAPKTLAMPPPSHTGTTMQARKVAWPLYKGKPSPEDIRQGELATCPIASILAAMANTAWGQTRIEQLTGKEISSVVTTTLSDDTVQQLNKNLEASGMPNQGKDVASDRYFGITISSPAIEVSDVLYVRDTDDAKNLDPVYMQALPQLNAEKAHRVLWPALIEKAYALRVGSYDVLDDYGTPTSPSVDSYWTVLVGSKPAKIVVKSGRDEAAIKAVAAAAKRSPAIAASREKPTKLTSLHGYAIIGVNGNRIELRDPEGHTEHITVDQFIADIDQVLSKP